MTPATGMHVAHDRARRFESLAATRDPALVKALILGTALTFFGVFLLLPLAAVFVEGAGKAEMHETKGGKMEPLNWAEIAPGATVTFERGGKHVMLFDLADTVKAGGTAEMTLTFSGGDKLSTPLRVETAGGTK